MTWTVLTLDGRDWVNTWTDNDQPTTFPTRADALDALAALLDAMPDYNADDFRIAND